KADFVSGKAKEDADMQEAERSKSAQSRNNAEQGAATLAGIGVEVAGRRNEGDGESANGSKKPGEPADPVDQRIAQLKKELSEGILLADGNGSMSDAKGGSGEVAAAKELSKKMAELKHLEGQKAAKSTLEVGATAGVVAGQLKLKPGGEIVEDSSGKLYQKQKVNGQSEWVEINPATMSPQRYQKGKDLMAYGAANGDLATYSKGLALTKGYGWNDSGLNMVGVRVPVDSQNATHNDFFLAINKGKLESVHFGSTQPGQKSYSGSAALGGVGEVSTGHTTIVMDDRRNGADSWKNAILGRTHDGKFTGARDVNADGNHSVTERAISALTNIGGVFFHQGNKDAVNISRDNPSKTLTVTLQPGRVDNYSQGCQITNMSYYYDAQSGTNKVFQPSDISKAQGKHGAYNSMENLIKNNSGFGYSVINSSDYSDGLMNKLNDLRSNARGELMQKELEKFKSDKPQYKDYNVKFNH
ncbi:hypothetical protein JWG45_04780, partial [Leptospira sp. 201903070]